MFFRNTIVFFIFFCSLQLFGVNFNGSYKMTAGTTQLFLVLNQSGSTLNGGLTGTTGADFKLQGKVEGEYATGKCYGSGLEVYFNLYFDGGELYLQLVELDSNGQPDWSRLKELVFKKSGSSSFQNSQQNYTGRSNSGGSNPLAKGSQKLFSGKFSGDGLVLNLSQSGKSVSGSMKFGQSKFMLKGTVVNGVLKGVFSSSDGNFDFLAKKSGSNMIFETDGTVYNLKCLNKGGSNPLAKKRNPLSSGKERNGGSSQSTVTNSGNRIKVDSMGLSFVAPSKWIAKKDPNTGSYIMGSNSIPGFILILPHSYSSLQELIDNSSQGFTDEGIQLYPTGQIETISNNTVGAEFSGIFKGVQAKAYVVGVVSPNGGGLLGLCLTTADKYSATHKSSAIELAKSVMFYKPKADTALMQALAGKYYSFTGSTERKLALCPNGVFYDSSESSYSGNFSNQYGNTGSWGAAGGDNGSGRWRAIGTKQSGTIIFTYKDGTEVEKQYQAGRDAFYLGGVKYGYNGQANCR